MVCRQFYLNQITAYNIFLIISCLLHLSLCYYYSCLLHGLHKRVCLFVLYSLCKICILLLPVSSVFFSLIQPHLFLLLFCMHTVFHLVIPQRSNFPPSKVLWIKPFSKCICTSNRDKNFIFTIRDISACKKFL